MCRLFGLNAGAARVRATFWLLDAPDSLEVQSHRNADGAGIGFFDAAGEPVVDKQPEAAFGDQDFTHEAQQAESLDFRRARQVRDGGRPDGAEHSSVLDGWPDHGARQGGPVSWRSWMRSSAPIATSCSVTPIPNGTSR